MSDSISVFSAMQTGAPLCAYKKTIRGKVHVSFLDPFSDQPDYTLLEGEENQDGSFIEIWTEKADMFFKKMNKKHFEAGRLVKMESKVVETVSPNQVTDTEIDQLLSSPFLTLQNKLNSFTDVAPVYRILKRAQELEKSEKMIKRIQETLAKLTLGNE